MRELGRKGGRGRNGPKPERVNEGLRDYLKREVPPERVWRALETAMLGSNESARVSASRVLIDALHEPHEDRNRQADTQRQAAEARQYVADALERKVRQRRDDPLAAIEELIEELRTDAVRMHPDLIVGDASPERAAAILDGLEEFGLLVPRGKVEDRAEELAQERPPSLKAEHRVVA